MKVLVSVSSRHGSAKEIGDTIAQTLKERGLDVHQGVPQDIDSIADYDALVLGSAVYMTQWMEEMLNFISVFSLQLRKKPLWAFSVGLAGVPKGSLQDPSRVGPALLSISPREHKLFSGKLDSAQLNMRERTIAKLGGAAEGDFRQFDEVKTWANRIADNLLK
ncbi:MAG: flavodoxin domain-containing protein [Varibaculum sp.]|nr:flavodoxin domain-containing protein [Varibaculum sp.]